MFSIYRYHKPRRVFIGAWPSWGGERENINSPERTIHRQRPEETGWAQEKASHRWWMWVSLCYLYILVSWYLEERWVHQHSRYANGPISTDWVRGLFIGMWHSYIGLSYTVRKPYFCIQLLAQRYAKTCLQNLFWHSCIFSPLTHFFLAFQT